MLKNQIMKKWENIRQTFIIDEIEAFASLIQKIGEKHNLYMLSNWGEKVVEQARCFEIDILPQTLQCYPELVEEICELCDLVGVKKRSLTLHDENEGNFF